MDQTDADQIKKCISGLPETNIAFGAKYAGRVVNNRTGETLDVLVVFRQYTGRGPVILSAVNPDMVVRQ